MKRSEHTLDASDQSFGRLATQVASLLRGKHRPEYEPHADCGDKVVIEHIDQMRITGKKLEQKIYYHYSGYPGGLRETTLARLIQTHGHGEVLKRAVWNMLPKNKLRKEIIKRLIIK